MRIHFHVNNQDTLKAISNAQKTSSVTLEKCSKHGSRSHRLAYEIVLSGESPHKSGSAEFAQEQAATWDQWGIFLAVLYSVDPYAKSWAYSDATDFHHKTGYRFDEGGVDGRNHPEYRRTSHKWEGNGYGELACKGHGKKNPTCTAVMYR